MTTSNHVNIGTIIELHNVGRCTRQARDEYKLTTHSVTVLVGCYLLYKFINKTFSYTKIRTFVSYYNDYRLKKHLSLLVDNKFINLSGDRYTMTSKGIDLINSIADKQNSLTYEFCNKYNIEL